MQETRSDCFYLGFHIVEFLLKWAKYYSRREKAVKSLNCLQHLLTLRKFFVFYLFFEILSLNNTHHGEDS